MGQGHCKGSSLGNPCKSFEGDGVLSLSDPSKKKAETPFQVVEGETASSSYISLWLMGRGTVRSDQVNVSRA